MIFLFQLYDELHSKIVIIKNAHFENHTYSLFDINICFLGKEKTFRDTFFNEMQSIFTLLYHIQVTMSVLLWELLHKVLYQSSNFYVLFQIHHKVNLFSLQHVLHYQIIHHSIAFHCDSNVPAIFWYLNAKKLQCILKLYFESHIQI